MMKFAAAITNWDTEVWEHVDYDQLPRLLRREVEVLEPSYRVEVEEALVWARRIDIQPGDSFEGRGVYVVALSDKAPTCSQAQAAHIARHGEEPSYLPEDDDSGDDSDGEDDGEDR